MARSCFIPRVVWTQTPSRAFTPRINSKWLHGCKSHPKELTLVQPAQNLPSIGQHHWLVSKPPGSDLAEQVCGDGHGQVGDVVVPQISASLSVRCFSQV